MCIQYARMLHHKLVGTQGLEVRCCSWKTWGQILQKLIYFTSCEARNTMMWWNKLTFGSIRHYFLFLVLISAWHFSYFGMCKLCMSYCLFKILTKHLINHLLKNNSNTVLLYNNWFNEYLQKGIIGLNFEDIENKLKMNIYDNVIW